MNKSARFLKFRPMDAVSVSIPLIFTILAAVARVWWLAIIELLILIIYSVLRVITRKKHNEQLYNYLQSMTEYLDEASRENLTCFPMPITLLDNKGDIIWYNDLFYEILKKNNIQTLFGQNVRRISETIDIERVAATHQRFSICYLGHYYTVYCMRQGQHDNFFYALYWMDDDAIKRENIRLKSERPCMAYIMIDSYDEIPSDVSEFQRSNFVTRVDVKVRNLSRSLGGILKKLETDKYLLIFEQKQLPKLEKNKFHILEEVKEISIGDRVHATLSVGVSRVQGDLHTIDRAARAALDMALSRGGDQVAVTNGEKYTFYGGKSETTEKRKRVKVRIISEAFANQVVNAENVIIMGHKYADLDCLGAAVSLAHCINILATPVHIVLHPKENMVGSMVETFSAIPEYSDIFVEPSKALKLMDENTLLVIVDTHSAVYVESERIYHAAKHIALIDHHRKVAVGAIENTLIRFHEPNASSCCEMVTELIDNLPNCQIGKAEANALMAGIILDTKNFSERTGVRTFEAAAYLKGKGADTAEVQKYFKNDIETYKKQIAMISNAAVFSDNIMISVYDGDSFDGIQMIASKAADNLLTLKGIVASFVVYKAEETVNISARSEADFNVQTVLEKLGGGGHRNAAGAQIANADVEEIAEQLKQILLKEEDNK